MELRLKRIYCKPKERNIVKRRKEIDMFYSDTSFWDFSYTFEYFFKFLEIVMYINNTLKIIYYL